ncbi:hypothetical protein POM88_009311 [Heracleum sosnowskyi]|uniref:Glycosyltransferase N-terminal domain-containing protein n=1 Tax=Heracleum sosnowskyi TaxID=360622 RepID=A0AAD8JAE2_9APIA|nr:hypothetical protein POM88_009311 [Heracleum sosnowskyi]
MVPFRAQGHINQLLQLSTTISATNDIPIHLVTTDILLHQAKSRFAGAPLANINFHEFTSRYNITKFWKIFQTLSTICRSWNASSPARCFCVHGVSLFWEVYGKPNIINDATVEHLPPIDSSFPIEFVEHITRNMKLLKLMTGFLYDGCRLLEGKDIDLMNSREMMGPDVKQWAVGPFDLLDVTPKTESSERHKSFKWLDEQSENSVIYVCFGTSVSISDEQVEELAIG